MPLTPDKSISFRPGTLAGAMQGRLDSTGESPSAYIRRLIAADCGVEAPEMLPGNRNPDKKLMRKAARARWKKHKRGPKHGN